MHKLNDSKGRWEPATRGWQRCRRRMSSLIVVVSFLSMGMWSIGAAPLPAQAGGTIAGQVLFSGKVPPPKEFAFKKFPNPAFCAKNMNKSVDGKIRLLKRVQVAKGGGLQDAIVTVRDLKDETWMKEYTGTKVHSELCEWSDFTGVVVNKGRFIVENHDADPDGQKSATGIRHNPHAFEVKKPSSLTLFNIGLAKKGDLLDRPIVLRKAEAGSVVRLLCDQHEFMQAWFLPVTNPHFVKVKEDGSFELVDVPSGKHKLAAWHPIAGLLEQEIDVQDGETVMVEFRLKGK